MTKDVSSNTVPMLVADRIARDLCKRICKGQWPVGSMFPSRRALALQYQAALGTIERAVAHLLADGTLQVVEGRGTFVARLPLLPHEPPAAPPPAPTTAPALIGVIGREHDVPADVRAHYWVPLTMHAIERQLADSGQRTRYYGLTKEQGDSVPELQRAVYLLLEDGVQGIIVIDYESDAAWIAQVLAAIGKAALPLVCITWTDIVGTTPHLFYDSRAMGYQAAEHLMQAGYRQLVYVAPYHSGWAEERFAGAEAAVRQCGMEDYTLQRFPLQPVADSLSAAEGQVARDFLAEYRAAAASGTLGIIASHDAVAGQLVQAILEEGLLPGRHCGVVGFDDRPFARELGLTSLRPPLQRLGIEGAKLCLRALQGETLPLQVRLQAELIPRLSTLRR